MNSIVNFLSSPIATLLTVVLINVFGAWLAFVVYSSNPRAINNKLLIWWMLPTILFINFGYLSSLFDLYNYSLYLKRLRFGSVAGFFMIGYFFFCVYFPQKRKEMVVMDKIHTASWIVVLFLSVFTGFMIKDVKSEFWGIDAVFGRGMLIYYLLTFFSISLFLYALFKKFFILSREYRIKIQYFLTGTCLYALFNLIFNIIFPIFYKSMHYYQFGDYSAIFFFGFIAYAIIKKDLFGIRAVLTTFFVGLAAILLVVDTFALTENPAIIIFKIIILIIFLWLGYILIKGIIKESERREAMEKLANQLKIANTKLKKLDAAKSEFISIASHQLRTPLTVIKGYLSMIIEGDFGVVAEKQKEPMKNVVESSDRLVRLVENMLNVSRIESGRIKYNLKTGRLEDLVKSVVDELSNKAKAKFLDLKFNTPAVPLPNIKMDEEKMRQVIINLIENSIKYTDKGSVTVDLKQDGKKIKFSVSDTGAGIKLDDLSKLFQKFSRGTGVTAAIDGTGLGLYVARQMVEAHKGHIWAESKGEGFGAKFCFTLSI